MAIAAALFLFAWKNDPAHLTVIAVLPKIYSALHEKRSKAMKTLLGNTINIKPALLVAPLKCRVQLGLSGFYSIASSQQIASCTHHNWALCPMRDRFCRVWWLLPDRKSASIQQQNGYRHQKLFHSCKWSFKDSYRNQGLELTKTVGLSILIKKLRIGLVEKTNSVFHLFFMSGLPWGACKSLWQHIGA